MQAVSDKERIHVLDVTRGIAVFGILLVNMRFFTASLQTIQWRISLWPEWWNAMTDRLIDVFVSGKFLSIFAFLFGYGMVIMKDRVEARGQPFARIYARRLAALALFGLAHGLFIWFGDILFHYAIVGFALLLLHRAEPRTLLTWAVILLALLPVVVLLSGASGPEAMLDSETEAWVVERIAYDELVYSRGSWADIQQVRIVDWLTSAFNHVTFYPQILGLFLLGAYFAKLRLLHDVLETRGALVKLAWWTGGAGLLITIAQPAMPDFAYIAGGPIIGLFYVAVIGILMSNPVWQQRLMLFAPVGRMAFTNYILQSVVCTLIFYSYGLGLYGQVGPLAATGIALAIYIVQIFVSRAWLARFRMGPLERLWRRLTYGRAAGATRV